MPVVRRFRGSRLSKKGLSGTARSRRVEEEPPLRAGRPLRPPVDAEELARRTAAVAQTYAAYLDRAGTSLALRG
jgi:hypothetical protein